MHRKKPEAQRSDIRHDAQATRQTLCEGKQARKRSAQFPFHLLQSTARSPGREICPRGAVGAFRVDKALAFVNRHC